MWVEQPDVAHLKLERGQRSGIDTMKLFLNSDNIPILVNGRALVRSSGVGGFHFVLVLQCPNLQRAIPKKK